MVGNSSSDSSAVVAMASETATLRAAAAGGSLVGTGGQRQGSVDRPRELPGVHGLGEVRGNARPTGLFDDRLVVLGAEHDDRRPKAVGAETADQLDPAHARHVHVGQDEVDVIVVGEVGERFLAVAGFGDGIEAAGVDQPHDQRADAGVVLYHQGRHVPFIGKRAAVL